MNRYTIQLDPEAYKLFRTIAFKKGISFSQLIRDILAQWYKNQQG